MPPLRDKLASSGNRIASRHSKTEDHPAVPNNYQEGSFVNVPIEMIKPNPNQPRQYFDPDSLNELSQSIKERGVLQPVIIKMDEDKNIILVAGERRLRAAKEAGVIEMPAIVTKGNPAEIALIENLQREDLKPLEEAKAFARMIEDYGYTQEQLAQVIGKAKSSVSEALSLNKLPDKIKEEVRRAELYPRRLLVEIAKQKTPKAMVSLFNKVKKGNLKSDQVREISRKANRTPAVIVSDKASQFYNSLQKLNLETIDQSEKLQLLTVLQNIRGLLDKVLD
jgi:ParB family chromosome partitioning protein